MVNCQECIALVLVLVVEKLVGKRGGDTFKSHVGAGDARGSHVSSSPAESVGPRGSKGRPLLEACPSLTLPPLPQNVTCLPSGSTESTKVKV